MTPHALSKLDIFSSLGPKEMERVRSLMKKQDAAEGSVLFREGDGVCQGSCRVSKIHG